MEPPELFVDNDHVKPVPLPPAASKAMAPSGGVEGVGGVMETLTVTVMEAVAVLPRESVTEATSVTLPVGPAV